MSDVEYILYDIKFNKILLRNKTFNLRTKIESAAIKIKNSGCELIITKTNSLLDVKNEFNDSLELYTR
jgi:hypothetical protein